LFRRSKSIGASPRVGGIIGGRCAAQLDIGSKAIQGAARSIGAWCGGIGIDGRTVAIAATRCLVGHSKRVSTRRSNRRVGFRGNKIVRPCPMIYRVGSVGRGGKADRGAGDGCFSNGDTRGRVVAHDLCGIIAETPIAIVVYAQNVGAGGIHRGAE
jgi:hypothetical protein